MQDFNFDEIVNNTDDLSYTSMLPPDIHPSELQVYFKDYSPTIDILMSSEFIEALAGFYGRQTHWAIVEQYVQEKRIAPQNVRMLRQAVADNIADSSEHIVDLVESAQTLQRDKPKPVALQVPKILPLVGSVALGGRPKIGKSYFALDLAIATATGGKFLRHYDIAYPGAVLYLALEDNRERMYSRMEGLYGAEKNWPENLGFIYKAPSMENGRLCRELGEWIESVETPRLIVVDIFARVKPRGKTGGDKYAEDYAAMAELGNMAKAYGVSALVVTHLNQAYGDVDDIFDSMMGTTGVIAAAETLYALTAEGNDGIDAALHITGKDVPKWSLALKRIPLADHIAWQAIGDLDLLGHNESRSEILKALYTWQGEAPKPAELREDLGRAKRAFNRIIDRMKKDQLITVEKGRLRLTDLGADSARLI